MNRLKELIFRLQKSKEGKTVISNFGYLSLLQIAGYIFPLITMPYLARVIGPSGFGKIAFASAIIVWIQTIADWGFNFTATRDVAQNRDNKKKVSEIFSNVLWARCLLTFISGILLSIAVYVVPYFKENATIIFVTFLMVPGYILFPDWFFQAIEKMKYITILNLLVKLIFTISVFLFVKEEKDYILQPLFTTIGYVICGIFALYVILHSWGYQLYRPNIGSIIKTIKNSADVFINNLMPNLYNSFSIMLLGFFGGSVANGIYDGGNKFPSIVYRFQSVLSRAFFPFLSRRSDKHKLYSIIELSISVIFTLLLIFLAPLIIRIMLGVEFEKSIIVMRILAVSTIFLSLCNIYGTNYLIVTHHERPLRNVTIVSSIIGMLISIPLVYYYSYIGAALTILICRMLLGISSLYLAKKCKKDYHIRSA